MRINRYKDVEMEFIMKDFINYINESDESETDKDIIESLYTLSSTIKYDVDLIELSKPIISHITKLVSILIEKYSKNNETINLCALASLSISYNKLGEEVTKIKPTTMDASIRTMLTELKLRSVSIATVESISDIIDYLPKLTSLLSGTSYNNIDSFAKADILELNIIVNKIKNIYNTYDMDIKKLSSTLENIINHGDLSAYKDILDTQLSKNKKEIINEDDIYN